jgi:DNA-binding response OmpR family regulator
MAKILVVEDEQDLRELIVLELEEVGHTTFEAKNGAQGLERLADQTPDLILSDITMPEMNGYQFFRSVKEGFPEHSQTPFILLTALSDRHDELKGLRLGVDDYLTKPIDFDLLIARVEASLRRVLTRPDQTAEPPLPSASGPIDPERSKASKVNAMVTGSDGKLLTGKFETISLDAIRERVGERWAAMSKQILQSAETVIQDHIGPNDVCYVTVKQDFIVCFADISEERIDADVSRIRDAIWDKLFGETDNEELSRIDGRAYAVSLERDQSRSEEDIFAGIDALIDREKAVSHEANRRKLNQIYQYENLFAVTLLNSNGSVSQIKQLTFQQKFSDLARKLFRQGPYDASFLLDLQKILFQRLQDKRTLRETFSHTAMLLPTNFAMIQDPDAKKGLIALCHDLENSIGADLLIDIIETPDRIQSQQRALAALPVGRKVQSLELRRTAQIDGLELGHLRELGVALVSMRYSDVINHEEQSLRHLIKLLEQVGTKFLIKEIPEGKLFEAQIRKAHLYAMRT